MTPRHDWRRSDTLVVIGVGIALAVAVLILAPAFRRMWG